MPTRVTAIQPDILEGRLDTLRVATPLFRGSIHLRIDGTPVEGTAEDEAHLRTLRDLQHRRLPVRVGVLTDGDGVHRFSWLVCPGKPAVAPIGYARQRRLYVRTLAGGVASLAAGLLLGWLLGTGSMWRVLGLVAAMVAVVVGAVFAGVALHALWRNWKIRAAILQSEAQYRDDDDGRPPLAVALVQPEPEPEPLPDLVPSLRRKRGRKARLAPAPVSTAELAAEYRLADEGEPPIAYVRGVLTSLTYESSQPFNTGQRWGLYRFIICGEPYLMRIGESTGNPDPFLAEGDRVELAVHAGESPRLDRHRIVYGLRNLEDGRVYLLHRTFRGGRAKDGPIGVGPRQLGELMRNAAGWLLAVWIMILGMVWFTVPDAHIAGMSTIGGVAFAVLLALWGCIVLPFIHADRRWRQGRPTQRQQNLERIYRVLGLGTPFAPTAKIEEL
jgi:hypothetical protein